MDKNETNSFIYYCEYLHSPDRPSSLWLDGPCTCVAAIFSTLGTCYALSFLWRTRLNKNMAASLYTLCVVDFMLVISTVLFLSIEANSLLILGRNVMYDKQSIILVLYGIRNSLAMSSTMLVIYITLVRYRVVRNPLKFAKNIESTRITLMKNNMAVQHDAKRNSFREASLEFCYEQHFENITRRYIRPFVIPILTVVLCFISHVPSYFEFGFVDCYDYHKKKKSKMLVPSVLRFQQEYIKWKAIFTSMTETIGPMLIISILSLLTEYRIHLNIITRRRLFESQKRSEDARVSEELKDKASKALAVFIVIKFLILRSLPTFIDIYEITVAPSQEFGQFMTMLTRISDFLVVLNSATNTLAYFGKGRFEKCFRWLEKRIRRRRTIEKSSQRSVSSNEKETDVILPLNGIEKEQIP